MQHGNPIRSRSVWHEPGASTGASIGLFGGSGGGRRLVAGAVLALALAWSPAARAQDEDSSIYSDAFNDILDGIVGSSTSELWGWALAGNSSAGTAAAISAGITTLNNDLTNIASELKAIESSISEIDCDFDIALDAGSAGLIQNYYATYAGWVSSPDMTCSPSVPQRQ